MNPLLPVMDRIVYIANGRIATGTTAEVVSSESLTKLYGVHVDVIHVHDRILVVAGRREEALQHGDAESIVELQAWLGHAEVRTTMRYTHYREQADAAQRLAAAFQAAPTESAPRGADRHARS